MRVFFCVVVLTVWSYGETWAESSAPRFELGLQWTGLHLHKIDETPFGVGGRFSYNLNTSMALDAEAVHYPQGRSGHFGETTGLFGLKTGKRFVRFGLFAKARTGFVRFSGDFSERRIDRKNRFEVDLGTVLEYYLTPRTVVRIDVGDTIIYFGKAHLQPSPVPLGTVHNFQPAIGFAFRF